ncbi:MAG: hypothetical protein AAFP82_14340, partial [Bacteroidota bacterium]
MSNKKNGILQTFLDWLLRRKNLNTILYILILFLIKELAAISASSQIVDYCNYLQSTNQESGILKFFTELTKLIFAEGSYGVLLVTISTILLIAFIRFIDSDNRINPYLKLLAFMGFSFVLFWSAVNLNKNSKEKPIVSSILLNTLEEIEKEAIPNLEKNMEKETAPSYTKLIEHSNPLLINFLKDFNDSISVNPNYRGVVYVSAPAGFGKSFFIKKFLKNHIPNNSIGKVKLRKDFVCGEQESKCYSDSLDIELREQPDLFYVKTGQDTIKLGMLYDYQISMDSIIQFCNLEDNNILMLDDLDEISISSSEWFLKETKRILENNLYPNIKLIVLLGRPESYVSTFSDTYFKAPKVDDIFGIEPNENLISPQFKTTKDIFNRVIDWTDYYGPEKLGRNFTEEEVQNIFNSLIALFEKHEYLLLQFAMSSNSGFLMQKIFDKTINVNSSEEFIKKTLLNEMVSRNSDSHHRPTLEDR